MWDIDKLQNAQSKRTKDKGKKKHIMYTDMMSLQKKKKKNYKRNCMKSLVVKRWPLEEEELLSGSAGW